MPFYSLVANTNWCLTWLLVALQGKYLKKMYEATILDKTREKFSPLLPPFQSWKKWCILIVERVHHWFRGRGVFISSIILSKIIEWSFLRRGVVQTKKPSLGGDWILAGKTQCHSLQMGWNNHPKIWHNILSSCSYTVFHQLLKMLGDTVTVQFPCQRRHFVFLHT